MYRRRTQGWMKHMDFVIQELICFQAAFCLSCMMRHGWINPYGFVLYRNTAIVAAMLQIFYIICFDVFKNILRRGYYREFLSCLRTVAITMLLLVFYLFLIRQGQTFSRFVLIGAAGYDLMFSYLFRSLRKYQLCKKREDNQGKKSLVVVTTGKEAEEVINQFQSRNVSEFCITGILLVDREPEDKEEISGIRVVAGQRGAVDYICRGWVDEVLFHVPALDSFCRELLQVMTEMCLVIHLWIGTNRDFPVSHKSLQQLGSGIVVTMSSHIRSLREAALKRGMDIIGGLAGCLLTGLLFFLLAPAIYIQSPGPVFFSQMRVGRNGKIFKIYKFRSMYLDAEERKAELAAQNEITDGMMFKLQEDPRIIGSEKGPGRGIGNFIRRTSLDEFPQFLNVLKGDMSLVGTRPPTLDEWEKYEPYHRGRLAIKPGLTGLWQISGRSEVKDFEEVVELDRRYIAEWSIGLDIRILLKTVAVVVKGEGAK